MKTQNLNVSAANSTIEWVGKKITGAHNGIIGIKEGNLVMESGNLIGGKFIVDMASIKILDIEDPSLNAKFFDHLASDDFFSIEKYPEAVLEISSVSGRKVTGNLTIKGITHPISFDSSVTLDDQSVLAKGSVIIDRTKYGIKFRSGNFFKNLGDTLIYNEFELNVQLSAKAE